MNEDIHVTEAPSRPDLLPFVARIVSAHASNNTVSVEAIPEVIRSVYAVLAGAGAAPPEASSAAQQEPAVPVKKSTSSTWIICLEEGKKLKTLKRHLRADH